MTKYSPTLQAALLYAEEYGFSVIPLSKSKVPFKDFPLEKHFNTRATREEIIAWWEKWPYANVGIVTGEVSGLFVVDFDKYDPKYDEQTALQYFPDSILTPSATTPRGGEHLYFAYPAGQEFTIKARSLPGTDYRANHGYVVAPPSVNGEGKPYQWKVNLTNADLAALPSLFIDYLSSNKDSYSYTNIIRGDSTPKSQNITDITNSHILAERGSRDDAVFHAITLLKRGGATDEELYKYGIILANSCDPPFPQDELMIKIESAVKRADKKEKNIARDLREWITSLEGHFNITEYHRESQIVTKEQKHACQVELGRLAKEGIIRKHGEKRGCYELIKKEEEAIIDIFSADNKPLPVKLPLDVHDLVKIMPKNIIILAGEVNAGKSAYLLNLAALNMRKFETVYFSSEMGGAELKERLQNFDFPLENWREVKFIEKASDFSTAIRPDGLNIIDFLEIHDEFYKVGALIKDIFDKLSTGLAVIAIQKNRGRDEGLGGQRSLEKPRLYMAMEPGKLKIVKAKNWLNSTMNPNGMCMEFKLAKGCYFKGTGTWKREEAF